MNKILTTGFASKVDFDGNEPKYFRLETMDTAPKNSKQSTAPSLSRYRKKMLLAGFGLLALFLLAGIFLSFHRWEKGFTFRGVNVWESYFNPIGQATYGPLIFGLVLFPITIPMLLVLSIPIYFGLKKQTRWPLVLLGFVLIGILWLLWITELWMMD